MNSPIINPWLFYLIGISTGIHNAFGFFAVMLLIVGGVCLFLKCIDEWKNKYYIPSFIMGCILGLISLFIPSTETCYQMIAASMMTPANIEATVDTTKSVVDYIVDSVDKIMNKED